ncbi:MAG: hypothetical protein ACT4OU_05015 [Hyphomicrobium sp.]
MSIVLRHLQLFARCERGATAVLFGFSIVVLVGAAGLAIDASRAASAKFALQQDLDATVLHVATHRVRSGDSVDVQATSETYLNGLRRARQAMGGLKVSVLESSASRIEISVETKVATTIARILGLGTLTVAASAQAEIGQQPVEVALALDNTTSMEGARLDALKQAAKSLIEIAFRSPDAANAVKIGIVPFAEYVNVGVDKRGATWLDVADDDLSGVKKYCEWDIAAKLLLGTCAAFTSSYTLDGVVYPSTGEACQFLQSGGGITTCQSTTTNTWRGCVGSRVYPLEMIDADYSLTIPGLMNAYCPQTITPLTSDVSALKADIDSMWASGNTYIPTGLIWGWRVLSDVEPYSEASSYGATVNTSPSGRS